MKLGTDFITIARIIISILMALLKLFANSNEDGNGEKLEENITV